MIDVGQFFNQSARQAGEAHDVGGPVVLVNTGFTDPTRGDSRAYTAIARELAQQHKGRYIYIHGDMLEVLYPGEKMPNLVERYCRDNDIIPDIYLSLGFGSQSLDFMRRNRVFHVTEINEKISNFNWNGLVAHDITKEVLKQEGALFRENYPETQGRFLIGAHIIHGSGNKLGLRNQTCADGLFNLARNHEPATLFLCGTRRTQSLTLNRLSAALKQLAIDNGKDIEIITYDMKKHRQKGTVEPDGFNPYKGLIAEADVSVAPAGSYSILSECVTGGKQVLVSELGWASASQITSFIWRGYGMALDKVSPNKPFKPKNIGYVSITAQIADKVWHHYQKYRRKNPRPQRSKMPKVA